MALVNPNIAMSYRAPEMPNQLANYAAMQQIQSGQRQGEAAQMQLDKMKRDEAALGTMMDTITSKGGPSDPMEAAQAMIKSRIPQYMEMGLKLQQTHQQLLQDRAAMGLPPVGGAAPAAPVNAMAPATEAYSGYNEAIGMPAPTNALAPTAAAPAAPVNAMAPSASKESQIMQAKQMLLSTNPGVRTAGEQQLKTLTAPIAPPVYHNVPGVGLVDPSTGRVVMPSVAAPTAPPAMVAEFNFAKTPEGGGFKGTYQDFVTARAAAGRAPVQPRPEQPPVAVIDPVTGKPVFVSREQAISEKMSPAAAQESLPPKEIQKREAALPQATTAVTGFEKKTDSFVKDLTALRDHPGLASITGIAAGRLPGLTADGRAAQALYDKVVAKGGFQALQDLRDASKTGGALGNVSNQEGKQLTASFSAIDRRQDAADVKAALDQAISDVQGARTRMREAYDMTYAYKGGEAPTPRAPGAAAPAANIDALLNKYK
jgi:hypothetical protein